MANYKNITARDKNIPRTTVLHLTADLEPDDLSREAVDAAVLTQRNGWRALMVSAGGRYVNEVERAAVRHRNLSVGSKSLLTRLMCSMRLDTIVQQERPALIHVHGMDALSCGIALAHKKRLPLILSLCQPVAPTKANRNLFKRLSKALFALRVPSRFMAVHLHDTFGLDASAINIIPPGVDLNVHSAGFISPERLHALNQLWRLPEQAAVLLMPMPLADQGGHSILLEALSLLRGEKIYAIMAGSDRANPGYRAQVEAEIVRRGLDGRVIMPEECSDLPAACWMASVIVAPNEAPRGVNLSVLAAQAVGRPVIVTRTGAHEEFVRQNETAWIIDTGDAKQLANAIREAIHLPTDIRLATADTAHNFIAENFPQSAYYNGMRELYDYLLHREPATASPHPQKTQQAQAAA
ncbi:MAG: glycosyltransferase [Alphaproteobacteria bacterium]|nr:glycosyltransferase [Alphaproteobacteria bacterium]MBV8549186.1 glycosyltransferase [Alphaproteobacteria bacterium]